MLAAGMFSLVACGPSAEQKAAAEKQTADSLAAVEATRIQDSIANVEKEAMAAQKAMEDSITASNMKAMQDSLAAVSSKMQKIDKKVNAPKPKVVKPEDVKAGQGKG